ncbi:sigma factor [Rhodovulum euryhalinum]|uniref:sigma factor n=1 Tax=Rhodovulum euryhalinum TaxID=35805 RepID=UPI001404D337|nr:sigma factor [Rhodovulum euryhalinum]
MISKQEADTLCVQYMGFASAEAARFHRKNPDMISDDLEGVAIEAMVKAAPRFNPARGYDFSTFVRHRIRGDLLDFSRKERRARGDLDAETVEPSFEPDHSEKCDVAAALERMSDIPGQRGMTARYAQELLLRRACGESHRDIAASEGVQPSTILRRERRALDMARATLKATRSDISET